MPKHQHERPTATFASVIQFACSKHRPDVPNDHQLPNLNPKDEQIYFFPSSVFHAAASASATFEPAALAHPLTALQTFPAV
jgi:hypothetical protein